MGRLALAVLLTFTSQTAQAKDASCFPALIPRSGKYWMCAPSKLLAGGLGKSPMLGIDFEAAPDSNIIIPEGCGITVSVFVEETTSPRLPQGLEARKVRSRGYPVTAATEDAVRHQTLHRYVSAPTQQIDVRLNIETRSNIRACRKLPMLTLYERMAQSVSPDAASARAAWNRKVETDEEEGGVRAGGAKGNKGKGTRAASKKATARLSDGMTYLKIGSLYIADQKVREAVELDPTAQDVRVAEALIKRLSGDAAGAADLIKKIKGSDGDPGASAYRLLKGLKPDPDLRLSPPPVPDGLVTGLLEEWDGNKDKALYAYTVAIKNDPGNWLALALRGLFKLDQQDCKGARADLREAVRKNSNFTGYAFKGYAETCGAGEAPE